MLNLFLATQPSITTIHHCLDCETFHMNSHFPIHRNVMTMTNVLKLHLKLVNLLQILFTTRFKQVKSYNRIFQKDK